MDYLSKKKEFIFLNSQNASVYVHTVQLRNYKYELYVEGKRKNIGRVCRYCFMLWIILKSRVFLPL